MGNAVQTLRTKFDKATVFMTGDERYPIIGDGVTGTQGVVIQSALSGLDRNWECNKKAAAAAAILGIKYITYGRMYVQSFDQNGMYGYEYNPPIEFHAWLQISDGIIIDFALPGVIQAGLDTGDDQGPMLVGNIPSILAGAAPPWVLYDPKEVLAI